MNHGDLSLSALARILRAAADEADAIARESAQDRREWVSQSESPIGRRKHIQAVRRRMQVGLGGAGQSGRRYLLSPEAIAEELGRPTAPPADEVSDLRAELSLVRGGRQ